MKKISVFQTDRMAQFFMDVLRNYRDHGKFLLHEFVLMPDHFHLLLTPKETLEKAMQLIKGGFSYRAKKELGYRGDLGTQLSRPSRAGCLEYERFREYTHQNPVKRGLATVAYAYSSATGVVPLDEVPQWLKPVKLAV
jgi:putative transposase